ncbi:cytochrome P450 3A19 [Colletotrichum scovillei]|uniref:cytochrome P450 3A19 n=1 Tax=Colletotrichum scovillei TaxID=1209932 RepID=UPI0015C305AF|nr:cytochrome P450 3A19 [Colletotrichum scovillei]KAF4778716.1 cytochrome P450 3A19 [Colletotrichum scovillei]
MDSPILEFQSEKLGLLSVPWDTAVLSFRATWGTLALYLGLFSIASPILLALYNYYFHPIAHVKGPFIASISPIWLIRSVSGHRLNNDIEKVHAEYGPVVRIGPNELSFATEDALKTIHNPGPDGGHFTKQGTIESLLAKLIWAAPNLLTTTDRTAHKRLRTALQPAFTAKALMEQEDIVQHHVNRAVDSLGSRLREDKIVSISDYVGKMIWSIVGDLSFGEPLLHDQMSTYEKMKYTYGKGAPLLELFQFLTETPILGGLAKLPVMIVPHIFRVPKNFLLMNQLRGCIERQGGRRDFLTAILSAKESAGLTQPEMLSNSALFAMVGYDTSATTLSAVFYHVLRDPDHYQRVQGEVREAYSSISDITAQSVLRLPYLNACIQETLRLTPPINGRGSHRISPGAMIDGLYVPKGVNVSADIWTIQRKPEYWALADKFRPDRWLDNGPGTVFEHDEVGGLTYRPFLVGPRVCIGREMALQSIRLTVAKVAFSFDLEMANKDTFVWERDAGNDYVWHDYHVLVRKRAH